MNQALELEKLDIASLSLAEKRSYMLALVTMASSDNDIAQPELDLIKRAAVLLKCMMRKKDMRCYDLSKLASSVTRVSLQRALFNDLVAMAQCDRKLEREELEMLRFFSFRWNIDLPELDGVKWDEVELPDADEIEKISANRRESLAARQKALKSADPGFQIEWMFASAMIYITICMAFGFMMATVGLQSSRSGIDPVATILGLLACFFTGYLVNSLSPTKTLREPGVGIAIPHFFFTSLAMFMVPKAGSVLLIGFLISATVMYAFALLGAWIARDRRD